MKSKIRFFYLSERHLRYKEIRLFRTKLSTSIVLVTGALLFSLLYINHYYFDFLGLGYSRITSLTNEKRILQQQLQKLTTQMAKMETTLDRLSDRSNELRLMVDLPKIDEDTRRAGVGGGAVSYDFGLASNDAGRLLNNSTSLLDKIAREIELQKKSYDEIYNRYEYNKDFFAGIPALKPMNGYYSTIGFGLRMHPVLGIYKTHDGLDIISDVGTAVYAAGNGVVEYATHSGGGYGKVILINHRYGYQTLYAHLSKIRVSEGQMVKRGERIAESGKTGLVSGPHLHYEVRHRGVKLNPIDFFLDDLPPQDYLPRLASRN